MQYNLFFSPFFKPSKWQIIKPRGVIGRLLQLVHTTEDIMGPINVGYPCNDPMIELTQTINVNTASLMMRASHIGVNVDMKRQRRGLSGVGDARKNS